MSLDTRNRPATLNAMAGNSSTISAVEKLFEKREKFPHAILITGPTGCGKTTLGRIISNMLGAHDVDYLEVDSAQFNGIDTVREIKAQMRYLPRHPDSECRVWLIDECHMLGTGGASEKNRAQNAILKMLEDAPDHVYFILCTTDPQRLLKTVVGRCLKLEVSTLQDKIMAILLKRVVRKERATLSEEILDMIVEKADGHPRNAMKLLEKIIGLDAEQAIELIDEESKKESQAIDLCRALIRGCPWSKVTKILIGLKDEDEEKIRRMCLSYCNTILLKGGVNPQAFIVMEEMEEPFYNTGKPGLTLACYRIFAGTGDNVPF